MSKSLLILIFIAATLPSASAQEKTGNILIDAMSDELQRSMQELSLPPFEKPFFMMYGIQDQSVHNISATLGSLAHSTEIRNRFRTNSRVLVGSYEFNDESLEDDLFSPGTMLDIQPPLDDDYMGIRRSFWSITDNVYRSAARHYQKHQETLKASGKALKDIPHRSFAKVEPTVLLLNETTYNWDRSYWEKYVRDLSGLFLGHPNIETSMVNLSFIHGERYAVNTEGTKFKVPFSTAVLNVVAQCKNQRGEMAFDQLTKYFRTPEPLKDLPAMSARVNEMITKLESQFSIPLFEEDYSGPVLIAGPAVADLLSGAILRGQENIMADDQIQKLTGYQFNRASQFDSKIGKPVVHESLSVKAKPKLREFQGVDLLGSFAIDNEGVVPSDEEVVISHGVLKALLNNRTLTSPTQRANGFSNGPGVIEVTSTIGDTEKQLKDKLLAKAKAAGLDYAIIIRDRSLMGTGFMMVNKIYVDDGREEPIRQVYIEAFEMRNLKKIGGASQKSSAYNVSLNQMGGGDPAAIVSLIVPDQILIEELDIKPMSLPLFHQEEYVPNPLAVE